MSGKHKQTPGTALSQIEVLFDQNLRKYDRIVKPLREWPTAHLLHLVELVNEEIDAREIGG